MSTMMNVYCRSPVWLQHFLVSAKGLHFRLRRQDTALTRKWWRFLLESQYWSQEQFVEYQLVQVRALLQIAFTHVPYYRRMSRELGCNANDFTSFSDFRQLPILKKNSLRGSERDFFNETVNLRRCYAGQTSGSTGTPIRYYASRDDFSRESAFIARLRSWAGLSETIYPRRAQFTGRAIVPPNQPATRHVYWRHNYPGKAILLSTSHISPETVPHYVSAIQRFRPTLIDGYPSALVAIARVADRLGVALPQPNAIITSAETLLPAWREDIETGFSCRVFDQYSSSEPSCFWCNCEEGGMHVNPECGISEIVRQDGSQVAPGEEGEVVTTSFLNHTTPLIRYCLGDVAVMGRNGECPCGRQMPLVEKVVGRVDDIFFIPDRGYVGRLDPIFKGLRNIIEAQIVQETLATIRVLIVPGDGFDESVSEKLTENLRAKVGKNVAIQCVLTDKIARGANGKFRTVVSQVRHLYPDGM